MILWLLVLILPSLFVFSSFFTSGTVVWGDAPYFYPERLKELVAEPYIWSNWEENLGGVSNTLWIYPLLLSYGLMHSIFGFENDLLIRIVFHFPAVILSLASSFLFARFLTRSWIISFFTSLFYSLNTYFLLLIDGGQVGVELGYGIFPLTLVAIYRFVYKVSLRNFFVSLLLFTILTICDIRIAVIALFTVFLWVILEWLVSRDTFLIRRILAILSIPSAAIFVGSYWSVSLLRLVDEGLNISSTRNEFVSLTHALFLFQPHWPFNEFGRVSSPPFYFVGIPLLVFGCLLFNQRVRTGGAYFIQRDKIITAFIILFLAFLGKGDSPPLGDIYRWVIEYIPFGGAFRDSTKFFIPLILFSGVLIGATAESLNSIFKNRFLKGSMLAVIYIYLIFLVHPAILGRFSGALAQREVPEDFRTIYQEILSKPGFFRTLWFPERHPFAFFQETKPSLNAKQLVELRPFASINTGTFNRLNFLHDPLSTDLLNTLGVKYLIFSGDFRKVLNQEESEEWKELLSLVDRIPGLARVSWNTSIPIYELLSPKPRVFTVDKLLVVLGSDNIYRKIRERDPNFSLANQAFLFLEDGKSDPLDLLDINPKSFVLVLNNRAETDLTMSFLQRFFLSSKDAISSQWTFRETTDYLRWKYEFLTNGVDVQEFDYQKGISFSTQPDEKIRFKLIIPSDGEYIIALRSLTKDSKDPLLLDGESVSYKNPGNFEWFLKNVQLDKGEQTVVIESKAGFHAVNSLALVPKDKWEEMKSLSARLLQTVEVLKTDGVKSKAEIGNLVTKSKWQPVSYREVNPVFYSIVFSKDGSWLVFGDSYHQRWKLKNKEGIVSSLPFYSAINGFYFSGFGEAQLVFDGQKEVQLGIYLSLASILILTGAYFLISRLND